MNPASTRTPKTAATTATTDKGRGRRIRSPKLTRGERTRERRTANARGTNRAFPRWRAATMTATPATVRTFEPSEPQGIAISNGR
jgi:hypothetical protein